MPGTNSGWCGKLWRMRNFLWLAGIRVLYDADVSDWLLAT